MSEPRDNVLFLGGRALAEAGYNKAASGMAAAAQRHYPAAVPPQPGPFHPDHRLAAHPHPLYHPSQPGPLPYLYARDYAVSPAPRVSRLTPSRSWPPLPPIVRTLITRTTAFPGTICLIRWSSSSRRPAPVRLRADDRPFCRLIRRPNSPFRLTCSPRTPPDTTVIGKTCATRSPLPHRCRHRHRFSDYPLPGFDRNKSLAAAQHQHQQQQHQQAVAATAAASQQNRNVLTMASQMHLMGNSAGHRQQVTSSSAMPAGRQLIAHHAYDADSESVPKRPRLITEQKPSLSLHQPLHIDTRDVHEMGKKVTARPADCPDPNHLSAAGLHAASGGHLSHSAERRRAAGPVPVQVHKRRPRPEHQSHRPGDF